MPPSDLHAPTAADSAEDDRGARLGDLVRTLTDMVRPFRGRLLLAVLLAVGAEVCTVGLAGTAAWLVVRASEQPPLAALAVAVTCIRAFGIGKGVLRYAERLASHDVGFRSLGTIRAQIVDRLAAVAPLPGWERGDVVRRAVDDVDQLLELVVRIVVPWSAYFAVSTAATVVMITLDPLTGIAVGAVVVAVGLLLPVAVFRHERRVGWPLAEARSALFARVLDLTDRVDLLVGAGLMGRASAGVAEAASAVERLESARQRERALSRGLVAAAPTCAVALVLLALGPTPSLPAPVVGVLVLWPLAVVELVGAVVDGARTLPEVAGAAHRARHLLTVEPSPPGPPLGASPTPTIHLDALCVRWPQAPEGLGPYDLDVPPSGRVTVTGPSGSGKSTLAASLVRFCPIVSGSYTIDGADAAAGDADDVRRAVLWVSQHPWIGDSTVRANLRIGDPAADDVRLRAVLATVELDDWLDRLPQGLDTWVGRGGVALSGGEAHRLALARALLAQQPVVVLDEPVSHLDPEMGRRVIGAIDGALRQRSLVLLDHAPPDSDGSTTTGLHVS